MAYVTGSYTGAIIPDTAVQGVETLTAAAAVHGSYLVIKQCRIKAIYFYVSTAIAASTTAPVVRGLRRPTYNSTVGQVVIGTLTIPNLTAAGKVMYKLNVPMTMFPGETITFEQTVQAVDATSAAGIGYYGFEVELDPEVPANQPNMIASV